MAPWGVVGKVRVSTSVFRSITETDELVPSLVRPTSAKLLSGVTATRASSSAPAESWGRQRGRDSSAAETVSMGIERDRRLRDYDLSKSGVKSGTTVNRGTTPRFHDP